MARFRVCLAYVFAARRTLGRFETIMDHEMELATEAARPLDSRKLEEMFESARRARGLHRVKEAIRRAIANRFPHQK
jgi:hypothetical protein